VPGRRKAIRRLHEALEADEIVVHYQPKVDVSTRRAVGAEALARWQHPTRGLLGPDQFIGLVESDPALTAAFAERILRRAISECARWRGEGLHLPVAVNVSAPLLRDPRLAATIRDALCSEQLDPKLLTLEITETALAEEGPDATDRLVELRSIGVSISLDDFGTGYSSLARLRTLPSTSSRSTGSSSDGSRARARTGRSSGSSSISAGSWAWPWSPRAWRTSRPGTSSNAWGARSRKA
jgi:EAL domain-containing protein (putative c-di-GMP-specific phosphodiesterase class I)